MRAAVLFLAFVAAAAMPAPVAAQSSEQTIYASVIGKKDRKPVEGLSVTDFVVKEDGVAREILRAGRTADPIDLAILVDNSQAIQPYVNDVRKAKEGQGLNAATGEITDLIKAGVIDPAMVTRSALQNAASIGKNILTTEAIVAEVPEKDGGGMPGMPGGMDGMM